MYNRNFCSLDQNYMTELNQKNRGNLINMCLLIFACGER